MSSLSSVLLQYYEMSYGLNIEMHKQVCSHIRDGVCTAKTLKVFTLVIEEYKHTHTHTYLTLVSTLIFKWL